ncbi:hypothetical protein AAG570_013151 [Ranatra chinensis]|uniref:Uncharacterized protein n=1 Tax=Ranatra chinensis TaxID=642074 RepID=A0ABD0YYD4_9HEMI
MEGSKSGLGDNVNCWDIEIIVNSAVGDVPGSIQDNADGFGLDHRDAASDKVGCEALCSGYLGSSSPAAKIVDPNRFRPSPSSAVVYSLQLHTKWGIAETGSDERN